MKKCYQNRRAALYALLLCTCLFPLTAQAQWPANTVVQIVRTKDCVEGSGSGIFKVSLSYPVPGPEDVVVSFTTAGTATNVLDYNILGLTGGNIVIPAGTTEKIINIAVFNDGIIEGPESVAINLVSATAGSTSLPIDPDNAGATIAIVDGNAASSTPLQVMSPSAMAEPGTNASFTIKLAGGATSAWPVTVAYQLTGTASPGEDFQIGTFVIPANTNSIIATVPIADDQVIEGPESITFSLLSGSATDGGGNAFIFPPDPVFADVSLSVGDNDAGAINRVLSVVSTANAAETGTPGQYMIGLPPGYVSAKPVLTSYTMSGTATINTDYTLPTYTLPAYINSDTLLLTPVNDALTEGAETAILTLNSGSDGAFTYSPATGAGQATVSIADNESLALHLLFFDGWLQDNRAVLLRWKTSGEEETAYFEVLGSNDGARYESAGIVQAEGGAINAYTFTDQPGHARNYYRLRIVDRSGTSSYSNVLRIGKGAGSAAAAIYPNPAGNYAVLRTGNGQSLPSRALLTDAAGRVLQTIPIRESVQPLSLDGLRAGIYFVKLENGEVIRLTKE